MRMAGAAGAPSAGSLGPDTPVGEIVDRKEGAREVLIEAGLTPLQDPAHLEMVRRAGIPLGHACNRHGIRRISPWSTRTFADASLRMPQNRLDAGHAIPAGG